MSDQAIDRSALHKTLQQLTRAEKLQLIEEVARSLREDGTEEYCQDHQAKLKRLRHELASLPVHNPADGFSNRDHDNALYGARR